jgi:hypothetical protein
MFVVEESIVIGRAANDVFAQVSDQTNAPRWQRGLAEVRRTTAGPIGVGTRHSVVRTFIGRRLELTNEYTQYEPGRLVEFAFEGSMPGVASYVVQPADGELTNLVARIEVRPSGLARLAEPLMAAAMRRDVVANLASLKTLLEAEPRRGAPG